MSSSPLYLAIVAVWILVLVPMLLRRDAADPAADGLRREPAEGGAGGTSHETADTEPSENAETEAEHAARAEPPPVVPRPARVSRARIIARRRRRTSVLALLLLGTGAAVALGLGPWWVLVPPVLLMAGHLVLLREAAKADAERRAAEAARRRRARQRARRRAEAARRARVVGLAKRRNQVYDQYTDAQRRAAGD
ncbi:divisome protein SepX/GlpR [Thermobifida cellulosilytica]|uniref:Transmembrane protein n=1 Tax=Thermobifida cellulosilytica TB100 TaxID=665004 RepID=A0A147KJW2_THECS|nr:hypothetical protein [Thermobifida cellulosilytica]KUP97600.1 hypothetical protein AC529_05950 [Thermobifida cellulosilytica TB100]